MLPKQYRLIEGDDFVETLKRGQRERGNFLDLKVRKTANELPRIGFLVTQKVAKKAANRNKIKRQLRAAMGHYIFGVRSGVDILVIAKDSIRGKSFPEIKAEVEELLEKRRLLI